MSTAALLLHDDEPTLALVRSLVESAGFQTGAVASAYRLQMIDSPAPPAFVVLGMTAIDDRDMDLVAYLRRRWPEAFMLALYPASLRERAARALSAGVDASLSEPFYPGEILSIARRVAARPISAVQAEVTPTEPEPAESPYGRGRPGAVEQLAAGVAHQVRNPLQILELQIGSAETGGALDAPGMHDQIRRIKDVIDSLTHFSGHRDLALRAIDVNRVVSRVFADRPGAAPGPSLVVRAGEERAEVLAAPELLRAGLESLRDRAERVTPAGGKIEVRTQTRHDDGKRVVEIAVTDGGPALSEERRGRLFEPYPDADGVQDGTGLELAALAGIVRDHGGSVAATAAPNGAGTTIVLRLPTREAAVKTEDR